jgi:hypothetical protein
MASKNIRAVLVANPQGIAKPLGDQQYRGVTPALQQGIGGDGGAHFYRLNPVRRYGLPWGEPQEFADALDGRIGVAIGVV